MFHWLSLTIGFFPTPVKNKKKPTVGSVIKEWREKFENERISEPNESAEHIVAHVVGTKKIFDLVTMHDRELSNEELEKLEILLECRLSRMPVQYIIGEWDFRDITLKLEPNVFIPRPETEILVDYLFKKISPRKDEKLKILEIGCGSGAISLSILHSNKNVHVTAIDINPQACNLTLHNAKKLNLNDGLTISNSKIIEDGLIIKGKNNQHENVDFSKQKFDYIISNPPYIPTKKIFRLQPEVRVFEDIKALDGGEDGLQLIKPILKYSVEGLNPKGTLFLEVDPKHPEQIKHLIQKDYSGILRLDHVYKDFSGNERIVEISKEN